jgi:hypothetical protein
MKLTPVGVLFLLVGLQSSGQQWTETEMRPDDNIVRLVDGRNGKLVEYEVASIWLGDAKSASNLLAGEGEVAVEVDGAQPRDKNALAVLCAVTPGALSFAGTPTTPDLESLAKDLTRQLAARQFDSIVTHFDETMTSEMPSANLAEFWDGLVGTSAPFSRSTGRPSRRSRSIKQCS